MELKNVKDNAKLLFFGLLTLLVVVIAKTIYEAISFFANTPEMSELIATPQNRVAEFFLLHFPYYAMSFIIVIMMILLIRNFMKKETPFIGKTALYLDIIGFFLIVTPIVYQGLLRIYNYFFSAQLIDGTRALIDSKFDLIPVVCGWAFLLMSYVFKYGMRLQQESDETL